LVGFLVLFAVIASPKNIHAQVEQGGITGRVFDEAGAVVPGATVTATQAGTGLVRDTVTNAAGLYNVPYLPVGSYDVTATLAGFTGARVTGVTIRVGLTATVDLSLKVARSPRRSRSPLTSLTWSWRARHSGTS
jgi:hypothetical protein